MEYFRMTLKRETQEMRAEGVQVGLAMSMRLHSPVDRRPRGGKIAPFNRRTLRHLFCSLSYIFFSPCTIVQRDVRILLTQAAVSCKSIKSSVGRPNGR